MYVTEVVPSNESLAFGVIDLAVTRCTQLKVELATFFAEHRKSVRNGDVEVSRTPDLKFWMLLGEVSRPLRQISFSFHEVLGYRTGARLVSERVARKMKWPSRKPKELARTNEEGTARRSPATAREPQSLQSGMGDGAIFACPLGVGRLVTQEMLKRCSTFSQEEEVRILLPFPLCPEPTKAVVKLESQSAPS